MGVRDPPTTIDGFVAEATNLERALSTRASHCNRLAGSPAVSTFASPRLDLGGVGIDNLREVIRDVVREELRKLTPAADRPASLSITEVVREEVQQALRPEAPVNVATLEEPTLSYAAIARRPAPTARQLSVQPRRDFATPPYPGCEEPAQYVHVERPVPRKSTCGALRIDDRSVTIAAKPTTSTVDALTCKWACGDSRRMPLDHALVSGQEISRITCDDHHILSGDPARRPLDV